MGVKRNIFRKELAQILNMGKLPSANKKGDLLKKYTQRIIKDNKDEIPTLYRYSNAECYNIFGILNENIALSKAVEMNDIFEGAVGSNKKDMENINKHFQSEMYLKCFSESNKNRLMWAHYADSFRGICVGYKFDKDELLNNLFPVVYNNRRFISVKPYQIKNNKYFFLKKSSEWRYEKEWRLIYSKNDLKNNTTFCTGHPLIDLCGCIESVTLGLRTDKCVEESIKQILKDKNISTDNKIKLKKLIVDGKNFKLKTKNLHV